jgi:hypothetical protein
MMKPEARNPKPESSLNDPMPESGKVTGALHWGIAASGIHSGFGFRASGLIASLVLTAATFADAPAAAPAPVATPAPAPAALPAPSKVEVFPDHVDLTTSRDFQTIVVQATYPDGVTRDLTAQSQFALADASLARIEGNKLTPTKDGATKLSVAVAGQTITLPVTVKDATADRPISFRLDVMPVMTRSGCNVGGCHGAARGKDGFHLSLFGYDPEGDYQTITRQQIGRRINLALPEDSLMLTKSTGKVQHTGGELFKADSELYSTVLRWLRAEAPNDKPDVAKVTGIEIMPTHMVMESTDQHHVTVVAHYSDGTDRDVTPLARFMTNNDTTAKVDAAGAIVAGQRGEAFVMARYDAFTVGSQVIVIPKNLQYTWPQTPENNYIDTLVHEKLRNLRILPSGLCTDDIYIRRVSIDVTGVLPAPEEVAAFIADTDPQKREKLVDRLLTRKEFVEIWVMKFAELLQIRSGNGNDGIPYKSAVQYYNWLSQQIGDNVPMNKIVQELLSSTGGTFSSPATNFYQIERDNLKLTENVAQVFMGMRVQCAQCHNHPFDRWTMSDYYSFAAFFSQIGRKRGEDPRETIVFNSGGGEVAHPVTKQNMPPKFLGGAVPDLKGRDRRAVLAEWLASPENPYFAKNLGNMVWAHFFGKGIVNPVDDVRVSNPASNPQLLEALGKKFTEYNYDFKKLVRDICTSRTYQLSTQVNETNALDNTNFSHSYIRRVRAEVLFDMISQVTATGKDNKFQGLPKGAHAVQIADGKASSYFLTTFGRATRDTVCSCEVKMEPNLSQALHLLNGDTVAQKIAAGGVISQLLTAKTPSEQIVEQLYLRCFSRKPAPEELSSLAPQIKDAPNPQQTYEDLFWAMLNSKEFLFNH